MLSLVLPLLGLLLLNAPAARAADVPPGRQFQLVLTNGASFTVYGPVERRGESFEFRDASGRLMTLDASQVREVRPLAVSVKSSGPVPDKAQTSPARPSPPVRYTNADLPPSLPAQETEAETSEAEAQAPESPTAADAVAPPIQVGSEIVETPKIVDGHDEAWWRRSAAEHRQKIVELERKENELYRDLVCVQHGLAIGSSDCNALLRPKLNVEVSQPQAQRLRDVRAQLEKRKQELAEFLERAFDRGVPTAWLLD